MCWKRQLPSSESLVGSVSTTDSPTTITEGISPCPITAILCSNYTGPIRTCLNGGICCDHDGVQLCSCQSGWTEEDCGVREIPGESLESMYGPGDSFNSLVILGSLIAVVLLVILILIVLLLRRYLQRRHTHTGTTDTSDTGRNGAKKLLTPNPEDGKTTQIRKDDLSIPVYSGATDSNS